MLISKQAFLLFFSWLVFQSSLAMNNKMVIDKKEKNYSDIDLFNELEDGNAMKVMQFLIHNPKEINKKDNRGWTVLSVALGYKNKLELIKYLVEKKADVKERIESGGSPLDVALTNHNSLEVIQYLIDQKADINEEDSTCGYTPLISALKANSKFEIIQCLINNKANVSSEDLFFLAKSSGIEAFKILGQCGIDLAIHDNKGKNILDYVDKKYHKDIYKIKKERTLEETKKIILFLIYNKKQAIYKIPKPIIQLIFQYAKIPAYNQGIFFFNEN